MRSDRVGTEAEAGVYTVVAIVTLSRLTCEYAMHYAVMKICFQCVS